MVLWLVTRAYGLSVGVKGLALVELWVQHLSESESIVIAPCPGWSISISCGGCEWCECGCKSTFRVAECGVRK